MIPSVGTDTATGGAVTLLDRITVRNDVANWRRPSPWAIAIGIGSSLAALPVAAATGSRSAGVPLLVLSVLMMAWLAALLVRRLWCDRHPYLSPRWLAAARATLGDALIEAALERLRDTVRYDPERVVRRGEMIEAILDEREARRDIARAATGVRLS